ALVAGQDLGKPPVGLRGLVEIAAMECDATSAEPGLHLRVADPAGRDDLAGLAIAFAARLGARHDAAGTVAGRLEAFGGPRTLDPGEDYGVVAHGAADKSGLSREGRGRALTDDP